LGRIGQMRLNVDEAFSSRLDQRTGFIGLSRLGDARHVGPRLRQGPRHRLAEPATCSRDKGDASVELEEVENHERGFALVAGIN
jgi:hypothetical protein